MNKVLLSVLLLLPAGCSSTFLVGKDGQGFFLESGAEPLYAWLYPTGDVVKSLPMRTFP
jgi:hypothetical protein